MSKRNSALIYAKAACYLIITYAIGEVVGHFWIIKPASVEEASLLQRMSSFHRNFAGGSMSPRDIQDGLNLCYGLFLVYTGLYNLIILNLFSTREILRKLILLTCIMLMIGSIVSLVFFFWLPVILFVITSAGFFVTYMRLKSVESSRTDDLLKRNSEKVRK